MKSFLVGTTFKVFSYFQGNAPMTSQQDYLLFNSTEILRRKYISTYHFSKWHISIHHTVERQKEKGREDNEKTLGTMKGSNFYE